MTQTMGMPNLKRVNINSEQELEVWLARNSNHEDCVMVVIHTKASHRKFVSREQIREVLTTHNWKAGRSYTLGSADLLGHVITKSVS